MRKIDMVLISLCILTLVFSACAADNMKGSTRVSTYSVTKSTGLYETFSVDAKMLEPLSVGTKLVPVNGSASLFCKTIVEFDTEYELCKIEVVDTGRTGWVLRKWIIED